MADPPKALVVDASVATKWHLREEPDAKQALDLLTRFSRGDLGLVAPDYIRYEVPAAITKATRGREPRLTQQEGEEAMAEFFALGIQTFDSETLISEAYRLVHLHGCALYDALYLALAQRLGFPLITADSRFYQQVRDLPAVVWIGDFPPIAG